MHFVQTRRVRDVDDERRREATVCATRRRHDIPRPRSRRNTRSFGKTRARRPPQPGIHFNFSQSAYASHTHAGDTNTPSNIYLYISESLLHLRMNPTDFPFFPLFSYFTHPPHLCIIPSVACHYFTDFKFVFISCSLSARNMVLFCSRVFHLVLLRRNPGQFYLICWLHSPFRIRSRCPRVVSFVVNEGLRCILFIKSAIQCTKHSAIAFGSVVPPKYSLGVFAHKTMHTELCGHYLWVSSRLYLQHKVQRGAHKQYPLAALSRLRVVILELNLDTRRSASVLLCPMDSSCRVVCLIRLHRMDPQWMRSRDVP